MGPWIIVCGVVVREGLRYVGRKGKLREKDVYRQHESLIVYKTSITRSRQKQIRHSYRGSLLIHGIDRI
jgi:hypothetical protein